MGLDCSVGGGGVRVPPARPLKIERVRHWCDDAERGLSQTFGHDRELIIEGVNAGGLELWKLWDGVAWMVTRFEAGTLTICCYEGAHARDMVRAVVDQAKQRGMRAVVFFTRRPGLARLLKEFEPQQQETVYRISVNE